MKVTGPLVVLPCCLGLIAAQIWARRTQRHQLADALAVGFLGGLLGTIAYDVARIPFVIAGMRVFAPIECYGVWVTGASLSSRFTDVSGWLYHFSNGITFGIMYAFPLARKHWAWALVWAFVLESMAVFSPFARIFHLLGDYRSIGIAYYGHVAYGLALGWVVRNWDHSVAQLRSLTNVHRWAFVLIVSAICATIIFNPELAARDARAQAGVFRVEGTRLNPSWLHLDGPGTIQVSNPDTADASILIPRGKQTIDAPAGQTKSQSFSEPAIYQVMIATPERSHSSFVIVEPVDRAK